MFRKLLATLVFAIPVFTAGAARADWYMLGAYDFQPYDRSTNYQFSGGRGGYVSSGFTSVKAPVRIPTGKAMRSLYCQVFDNSAARDITVTLGELTSSDVYANFGERSIMSMSSSGAPGHVKISTTTINGSNVTKTFECAGNSCTYYNYYLTISLPDASNTSIKGCALYWD